MGPAGRSVPRKLESVRDSRSCRAYSEVWASLHRPRLLWRRDLIFQKESQSAIQVVSMARGSVLDMFRHVGASIRVSNDSSGASDLAHCCRVLPLDIPAGHADRLLLSRGLRYGVAWLRPGSWTTGCAAQQKTPVGGVSSLARPIRTMRDSRKLNLQANEPQDPASSIPRMRAPG